MSPDTVMLELEADVGAIVRDDGAVILTCPFPTIKDDVNHDVVTPSETFIE